MDHISTLCALSTVGIATTGLALGRVERTKSKPLRRKTLTHEPPLPKLTEATSVDVRPKTSRSVRPNPGGAGWTLGGNENETDSDGPRGVQSHGPDSRRASLSFGAARLRRRGQTLTNPPLQIPENEPAEPSARRPSTSWLRRLSMVSFQSETPSTGSPVTPSFNGSASPILPRPSSQRRSPNKLIKRTSSQRSNVPLFVNTSIPPPSGLRRPATSYQRSETMRLQSPLVAEFESQMFDRYSLEFDDFSVNSQDDWKPYLSPKSGGLSERLARKISTTGSSMSANVRRIMPDQDSLPALVLATTITSNASPTSHGQAEPVTPLEFRNPFKTDTTDQITPLTSPPPAKPTHKHSYSMNDVEPKKIIVNSVTASGIPIMGRPRGGSLKRVKGRTFSIPRSELSSRETAIPRSPPASALPQRRNITDPSIFRQPQALSPSGLYSPACERDSQIGPRAVSQDYNVGMRRHRPLTTDAMALSAWQQSSRPESNAYSLRRQPKRHSIAASDPSSTVIGSDDTRVFTSSDEYDTDLMTDYWDSIRTRETSASGLKGLRIETMFDKAGARLSNEEVTTLEELLPRGSFASRMERDPPLFPDSFLPAAPVHVNLSDPNLLSDDGEEDTRSMIGDLPAKPDNLLSPISPTSLAESLSNPLEQSGPGLSAVMHPASLEEPSVAQKMSIFDWSEQSRGDRDTSDSEARPRTVHGKQNGIDRGSRAACRKVPSTIHLRSQSVPVARDSTITESRQTSGKFGTWGLGSKGVSEDWDSDFDFDDDNEAPSSQDAKTNDSECPSHSMAVPQAILERQASLRGQFGQVQELTLLVEELKRLRHQASVLNILTGPSSELWKEAEGIVNLATIDEDDDRRSPPGSPSSLTFSFDDSDEEGLNTSSKQDSTASWQESHSHGESPPSSTFKPSKPDTDDPLQLDDQIYTSPLKQFSKDSPKSKSALEFVQPGRQSNNSPLPRLASPPRPQKLPFDTSSLRNLVVRAGVVTRALKEVIRKAEGVEPNSQDVFPSDPPFRRIFDQPSHDDFASFEAALAEMQ